MNKFWSRRIGDIVPYTPGEQPKDRQFIKLNTNECPYPPSPAALAAIRAAAGESLRLYPDPECADLRAAIAAREGIDPAQVFCGNGSDELLAFAFQAFFDPDRDVVFPKITYSFYPVYTDFFGLKRREVPMNPDFSDPVDLLCGNNGGVVLANPNAPTGIAVGLDTVEKLLRANPDVVVIVDEAYVDFGGRSVLPLLEKYENLMVVQTFSKSRAMAGMRIGFAIANEKLIGYLKDVKFSFNSYTMGLPAILAGKAALLDQAYFKETVGKIIDTREWAKEQLKGLGFTLTDSKSNFVFASHRSIPAREIFQALKENNIYVRYWDKPRINNHLRITIGTREQMETLVAFLENYIKER